MILSIDNLFLDAQDGSRVYNVEGFAYSSRGLQDGSKPTYLLLNKWKEAKKNHNRKKEYNQSILIFMTTNLFEGYFLKDVKIVRRLDLIYINGQLRKGEEKNLAVYGINITN